MRDHLVFYVNDQRHTVSDRDALLTLTDYLREGRGSCNHRYVGTKVACAEGDCGACSVLIGRLDKQTQALKYQTIDACIAFVYQLDRCHVITVEGIASDKALSAVQQAMVDCHGSQCGFCTPGFVMAMHGLAEKQPDESIEHLTEDELRLGLSGNLCRCTGYSQILEAGQAFQRSDAQGIATKFETSAMQDDFNDLGSDPVMIKSLPDPQLNGEAQTSAHEIFLPTTLSELLEHKANNPSSRLVAGATDLGVQHNHGKFSSDNVVFTLGVEELNNIEIVDNHLSVGAAANWARIEEFVKEQLPEYHQVLIRFGSPQVRNAGTLAGNLANASPIADSIPLHYVTESTLELANANGSRQVAIEDFYLGYKELDLRPDEVIVKISTPLPEENEYLKLYKISKRRDMDISTVTLAFLLELDGNIIRSAKIAAGGVGPTVVRLRKAESKLLDQEFSESTMGNAGRQAREEITPISDVRGSAEFRLQLIENLFVKCFYDYSTTPNSVEV